MLANKPPLYLATILTNPTQLLIQETTFISTSNKKVHPRTNNNFLTKLTIVFI